MSGIGKERRSEGPGKQFGAPEIAEILIGDLIGTIASKPDVDTLGQRAINMFQGSEGLARTSSLWMEVQVTGDPRLLMGMMMNDRGVVIDTSTLRDELVGHIQGFLALTPDARQEYVLNLQRQQQHPRSPK